jgi:hypothetical protein
MNKSSLLRTQQFRFLSLPLLLIFAGSSFWRCEPAEVKQLKPVPIVLAFCDITDSVDQQSIDAMSGKISELAKDLPKGSHILVYPIDNTDYPEPLLDLDIPDCTNDRLTGHLANLAVKKCEDSKEQQIDGLTAKIRKRYEDLKQSKAQRSCIISTLSAVNDYFKNKDRSRYIFEVVYLSDMVEQCNSSVGRIYLCSSRSRPNKAGIEKIIDSAYNPSFNLKNLIGTNISIIVSSKMLGSDNSECLFADEQREIWHRVFEKVGYSSADFDSFSFSSAVPDRLKAYSHQGEGEEGQ